MALQSAESSRILWGGSARPSLGQTVRPELERGFACSQGFVFLVMVGLFGPVGPMGRGLSLQVPQGGAPISNYLKIDHQPPVIPACAGIQTPGYLPIPQTVLAPMLFEIVTKPTGALVGA